MIQRLTLFVCIQNEAITGWIYLTVDAHGEYEYEENHCPDGRARHVGYGLWDDYEYQAWT